MKCQFCDKHIVKDCKIFAIDDCIMINDNNIKCVKLGVLLICEECYSTKVIVNMRK